MADSAVETKETTPVVEKESVTSSVKESPKKETNGSAKAEEKAENGSGDKASDVAAPKENGSADNGEKDDDVEEVKENGAGDACPIKRKSDVCEAPTPEKKAKVVEDESPAVAEESNDAEAIEA